MTQSTYARSTIRIIMFHQKRHTAAAAKGGTSTLPTAITDLRIEQNSKWRRYLFRNLASKLRSKVMETKKQDAQSKFNADVEEQGTGEEYPIFQQKAPCP